MVKCEWVLVEGLGCCYLLSPEREKGKLREMLHALCPGDSKLQILLHFRISQFRPDKSKKWHSNVNWLFWHKLTAFQGSQIWRKVVKAWKIICCGSWNVSHPSSLEEFLNEDI
jgi:hypothetical protein